MHHFSSLSVILNSTAGVLLEDICRGCFKSKPSEKASNAIVKGSVLVLGALSMVFLLIVEKLGGILEVATSLSAIAAGTTFGVFTLGMLVLVSLPLFFLFDFFLHFYRFNLLINFS